MGIMSGKTIVKVKVLGVTMEANTKVLATYNNPVYCLGVLYEDGHKELVECDGKEFSKRYLHYVNI